MRDVIVIGAGADGPVVAKELAERGLDVLLLEAGPRLANSEQDWTHFEIDQNSFLQSRFRVGPANRDEPAWFRETAQNSLIFQVAGVGGTTLHYFGNCPRAYPGVFQGYSGADRSAYDTAHPFPFSYAELRPYYEWVEATLPVQTAPMGTKEQVFFEGAQNIGLPVLARKDLDGDSFRPQENAILQPGGTAGLTRDAARLTFPQATGCTFCGYCAQGCIEPIKAPRNLKAKRSTDNSYIPMALTADLWKTGAKAVTLIANAFVIRINTSSSVFNRTPIARSVTWKDTVSADTHTEEAKVIVMAGGCIEDPRLWLNSGLPNSNGWVGRGMTDHAFDFVTGVFPKFTGSSRGPSSAARADFPGKGGLEQVGIPPALQAFTWSLSDSGIRGAYDDGRGTTGPWDGPSGRIAGREMKEMLDNIDQLVNILVLTDDDVERQNAVDLSILPVDKNGKPPRVVMKKRTRSARTLANREFLARKAAEILRAAGATKIVRIDMAPLLLHLQSSMRMGASASDSVLDANAESRAVRRLYVASHSALPNGLGGANPTLTGQAMATRTAEKIFQKYFGGMPWVGRETPVSSIDQVVTDAVLARGIS